MSRLLKLIGVPFAALLLACSPSSNAADAGGGDGGGDGGVALQSCGATVDCPDGDVCAYQAVNNGCSLTGQCRVISMPADLSGCSAETEVCPCSGSTMTVPPCWNGYSPVAVLNVGPCCAPMTCGDVHASCGRASDGCNGELECGICPTGMICYKGGCINPPTDASVDGS
jgi:hypothetical protein